MLKRRESGKKGGSGKPKTIVDFIVILYAHLQNQDNGPNNKRIHQIANLMRILLFGLKRVVDFTEIIIVELVVQTIFSFFFLSFLSISLSFRVVTSIRCCWHCHCNLKWLRVTRFRTERLKMISLMVWPSIYLVGEEVFCVCVCGFRIIIEWNITFKCSTIMWWNATNFCIVRTLVLVWLCMVVRVFDGMPQVRARTQNFALIQLNRFQFYISLSAHSWMMIIHTLAVMESLTNHSPE